MAGTTSLDRLAEQLHETFVHNEWEFEGYGQPEVSDVKVFLETCVQHLHDKPDGTVLSVNNMSVRRNVDQYEVYVHVGNFERKSDG